MKNPRLATDPPVAASTSPPTSRRVWTAEHARPFGVVGGRVWIDSAPAGELWVHGQIPITRKEGGPPELLPEHELRVRRVLGGSLSLPAIAAELRQPPNTARAHTQAIYPSSASPHGMTPSPKEKRPASCKPGGGSCLRSWPLLWEGSL
jgi:hypothetical protein